MRILYSLLILSIFFLTSCKESADTHSTIVDGEVNWMTIDQADQLKGKTDKIFMVDVYTDWCGWCKVMDKKTFTDTEVQNYLDEGFHAVKFDAEQKAPINFDGNSYDWIPTGRKGVNKLAFKLLSGRLSYPSIVFLNSNLEPIQVVPGYKTPVQMMEVLKTIKAKA